MINSLEFDCQAATDYPKIVACSAHGFDLRQQPLETRRQALKRLVAKRRGDGILFNEALAEERSVVFVEACELGLEGIVSKRAEASIGAAEAETG